MANSISGLITTLIATEAAQFLHAKSALLGRVRVETRQERDVAQGGNTVNVPLPAAEMTPNTWTFPDTPSYTDIQNITIPTVPLTFNIQQRIRVKANQLESRYAAGNLDNILALTKPGMLEGITRSIDKSLIALYTGLSTTPVGSAGVALTDQTVRNAIAALSANNVDPSTGDVHMVLGDQVYWLQLGAIADYKPAYAVGDNRFIREGDVGNLYGLRVNYSQNIVQSASSPVTTNNLVFHKDAFMIGFLQFEPAKKYSDTAPLDETIYTDPNTGISVRAQMSYDVQLQAWIYSVDVLCGVAVYAANRGVVIKT